ncbi:MAG: DUF222 domain-containing protein [Propionibacteriaceae bacterium]|nr:DUF222 domain-containing protein [Propionibacteriaceae bacterium]
MDERTPSAAPALAGARSLLAAIDHDDRARLDAVTRLALVTEAVALCREADALRAVLVGEADRAKAGETARGAGIKTLLAVSSKVTGGEAAAWLYSGRELLAHPRVAQAALSGEVSVSQARAIDTVLGELPATLSAEQRDAAEDILLAQAHRVDANDLAKQTPDVLRQVAPEVDAAEDEMARLDAQRKQAWASRSVRFSSDRRGSVLFRGQLPTLEGEAFKRLVESYAVSNRRMVERSADRPGRAEGLSAIEKNRSFEQRTADGLIALVTSREQGGPDGGSDAEAGRDAPGRRPAPAKSTVVVTFSFDDLLQRVEQAGVLASGERITAGDLRRLACDARLVPIVLGSTSEPLDVGRSQRLVTPGIRKALETRDKQCAFPGCCVGVTGCEAHHIVPWWAGGATALHNLVLLCPHHHSMIEPLRFFGGGAPTPRWTVQIDDGGQPEFTPPAGVQPGLDPATRPAAAFELTSAPALDRRLATPVGSQDVLVE